MAGPADWDKTGTVLARIADLLQAHVADGEHALADLDIADSRTIDEYINSAEAGVAQLTALQAELDTYWPPDQAGGRGRGAVPDYILALSDRVSELTDRAARLEETQAEILGRRMDRAEGALRLTRLSHQTQSRYHRPAAETGPRLLDLRS